LPSLWRNVIVRLESDRACWLVLGVAMALSAALRLRLTRGTTLYFDEVSFFVSNRGFDPHVLLSPHNGSLVLVPRLIYASVFKLFGADYLVFRILEVAGVLSVAGLFFAVAKRRVGAPAALALSVALLFLGSAWFVTLTPLGIQHAYSLAAGLGAILAVERGDRRGDLVTCALLVISVAGFSIGLAFLAGIAVSVLLRDDRRSRLWVFLVPLTLYAVWLVTAPQGTELGGVGRLHLSNALLIPVGIADAAATVSAALLGLSYQFSTGPSDIDSSWGPVVAALAAVALVLRLRRGNIPVSLWTSLAIAIAFWVSTALVTGLGRSPITSRYVYAGAVALLLVATDAARGIRPSPAALLAIYAAGAISVATNLAQLRDGGHLARTDGAHLRAQLTALELARDRVDPGYVPQADPLHLLGFRAGPLLAASDRNGSFAFSLPGLRGQPEDGREVADSTLAGALDLRVSSATTPPAGRGCRRHGRSEATDIILRPPGALLRSDVPQRVTLRRFAVIPTAKVGSLSPGQSAVVRIPADRAAAPWHAWLTPARPVTVCALPPARSGR
jgi:hypothetical protein